MAPACLFRVADWPKSGIKSGTAVLAALDPEAAAPGTDPLMLLALYQPPPTRGLTHPRPKLLNQVRTAAFCMGPGGSALG